MKIAVYGGSFDPITLGHLDIIKRAGAQYDYVVIAVAVNPLKKGIFDASERGRLILDAVGADVEMGAAGDAKILFHADASKYIVVLLPHGTALVRFAQSIGASALIRGLRAVSDFEDEFKMALTNRHLANDIETVFLMTSHKYLFTSSSTVRELIGLKEDLSFFVPPNVAQALAKKQDQ